MVLHIILRHFKGKIVVCSRCQLLISINVSSKIKKSYHYFIIIIIIVCVYLHRSCWSLAVIKFNIVWGGEGGGRASAKFDTLGGIGHSPQVQPVGVFSLVGVFLGMKLIGYSH